MSARKPPKPAHPTNDAHAVARLARERAGDLIGVAPRAYTDTLATLADRIDALADHTYRIELALYDVAKAEHEQGCCWRCQFIAREALGLPHTKAQRRQQAATS